MRVFNELQMILIAVKQEQEIVCQLVEKIRKMVITPVIVLLPDHSEMRNKIIQAGADVVLTQLYTECFKIVTFPYQCGNFLLIGYSYQKKEEERAHAGGSKIT